MPWSRRSRDGQGAEQLLGGERDVEEEPDPGAGQPVAQEPGQEKQLVVVHPDQVAGAVVGRDHVGERLVRLDVALPVAHLERDLIQQVVEQRPEHAVRVALVEPGDQVGGERDLDQPHGGELPVKAGLLHGVEVGRGARPADPQPIRVLVRPHEPGGEAAGAPLHLDAAFGGADGDGQPVGDDQEPGHRGKVTAGGGGEGRTMRTIGREGVGR